MEEPKDDSNKNLGVNILGKHIGEIPCLRDSYFYGICTGIFGGFGYFMFTSKVRMATHVGMGTFAASTLAYWTYCRMNYARELKEAMLLKEFMVEKITKEGPEDKNSPSIITI